MKKLILNYLLILNINISLQYDNFNNNIYNIIDNYYQLCYNNNITLSCQILNSIIYYERQCVIGNSTILTCPYKIYNNLLNIIISININYTVKFIITFFYFIINLYLDILIKKDIS
jgi:hypothetical protein